MNYTITTLVLAGIAGILCHNLIKMNNINRKAKGDFSFSKYFKIERFTILLSLIVVLFASFFSQEVTELSKAGKYLAMGMFSIGFMAQSLLVTWMGKAHKMIDSDEK